ncbi:hypothetical protein SAMN04487866_12239 [Thermoactinomyces sp. DSM 45891]|uniref:hypothetical protein n=1 Tax=Thermoactinomyces sp. DSM 45891 TaxID=1761907 RepID=UPI00090FFFCC|nr:hypothetical protein [Thermoactinomyces sp. DSM 45891]SFX75225.1 hypothetical protein SAMN04487866_12239 [Thermoactinomyces sp. DSM 45891]
MDKNIEFIFVEFPNGSQPALETIISIGQLGIQGDPFYYDLGTYIRKGLLSLEETGIPEWHLVNDYRLVEITSKGYKVTFNLLKRLDYNFPLIEFRINWRYSPADPVDQGVAFRMILFTHEEESTQYVLFTDAVIKTERSSSEFKQIAEASYLIYQDFKKDPSKYLGGEKVEQETENV